MDILLRIALLYLTIISGSLFISEKFNKKMESSIGFNLLTIIIFLYITGIFNLLLVGVAIIVGTELILGTLTIAKYIKEKQINKLKEKFFTIGMLVFFIAFFWIGLISINKELTNWDQFSYWSYATKNMYISNSFIIDPGIGMQYPPAPTIIQYFFSKVIGIYLQGFEAFSMQILGISLLLPWLENETRSKYSKLAIIVLIFCLPTIFPNMIFYESSYPDVLLGLLIGYICINFFKEEKSLFTILKILVGLSVLTLTKPTGIFLSIIVVIIAGLYEIIMAKKVKKVNLIKRNKNIKVIFISLITIILIFTSWTIYKNINEPSEGRIKTSNAKENPISIVVNSILTTVLGIDNDTFYEAVSNQTIVEKIYKVDAIFSPISISIAGVISILIIISIYFIANKLEEEKRNRAIIITICLIIGLILYMGILQVAYITMFNHKEMMAHAGIDRYMPTFLIGIIYILINYFLAYLDRKQVKTIAYVLLAAVIVSMTPINSIMNMTITSGISNLRDSNICSVGKYHSYQIEKLTKEDAKTFIICQDDGKKLYQYMIRYYMYPTIIDLNEFTENMDKINISLEDWINTLKQRKFEYVYILATDDEFYEYASSIFEDNKIEDKTLYKIYPDGKSIKLIKIEEK